MTQEITNVEEFISENGQKYYSWINYDALINPHKYIREDNKKLKDAIKINIPSGQTPEQTAEIIKQKINEEKNKNV